MWALRGEGHVRRLAVLAALACSSCATWDERMAEHHQAFYGGRLPDAVAGLRSEVDGADAESVDLLRLELASALQASGEHAEAATLYSEVDDGLEVLDYTTDSLEAVSAFAFSGETAVWKASPPERVMVNTQAMLCRLAAGDLEGAQVEARRLGILLDQADIPESEKFANPFSLGLAGFCLHRGRNPLEAGDFWSRLTVNPFAPSPEFGPDQGTVLVVAQTGKAPIRREAIYPLWIDELPRTLRVPAMVRRDVGFTGAEVVVDGAPHGALSPLFDLGEHLMRRYEQELPSLLIAAATQAAIRAVAAEATKAATESAMESDSDTAGWSAFFGFLAGLFTEVALGEMMQADTRCWSLLPNRMEVLRLDLPAGPHQIDVLLTYGGSTRQVVRRTVEVTPGGLVLLDVVSDLYSGYTPPPDPREVDEPDNPAVLAAIEAFEEAFAVHAILD